MESMRRHCEAMVEMQNRGSIVFDYGNNLRGQALKPDSKTPLRIPDLSRRTSGHCSVREGAHSDGRLYP